MELVQDTGHSRACLNGSLDSSGFHCGQFGFPVLKNQFVRF